MKRRTILKVTSLTAAAAAAGVLPKIAFSQTRWDLANEYESGSLHAETDRVFADTLEELTNGEIQITHHTGGALGYDSVDHFDAVGDGALPMADTLLTQLGGINQLFELSSLPFLVADMDEARILWEIAQPYYDEVFRANNQILLYASAWPPSGIWADRPIRSMEDLDGLRIRTYDANGTRTFRESVGRPNQLSWSDVIPQLQAGGIDAVLTSAEGGVAANMWENLAAFTEINYASPLNAGHINKMEFEALSGDQQDAVMQAAQAAIDYTWENVPRRVEQNYAEMEEHGVDIETSPDAEMMEHLQEAAESVIERWSDGAGSAGQEILDEFYSRVGR